MNFKKALLLFSVAVVLVSYAASSAEAQWVRFGVGVPAYRPYPYYWPYYARPYYPYRYRVHAAPAPIYVAPPPVYYSRPDPVIRQYSSSYSLPSAVPTPTSPASRNTTPTLVPPPPQPMSPATPPTLTTPPATTPATPTPDTIPSLPNQS